MTARKIVSALLEGEVIPDPRSLLRELPQVMSSWLSERGFVFDNGSWRRMGKRWHIAASPPPEGRGGWYVSLMLTKWKEGREVDSFYLPTDDALKQRITLLIRNDRL